MTGPAGGLADGGAGALSLRLLDHDGLMTPVLRAQFGALRAVQHRALREGDIYLRQSTIRRRAGGETILTARLEIRTDALPGGFLDDLAGGEVPFGQLLQDRAIGVEIRDREVFRVTAADGTAPRWGRRLAIHRLSDGALVCRVEEILAPEAELLRLSRP